MKKNCQDCKHFNQDDGMCDGCSNTSDDSCSCHINPPCSICENNHFEEKEIKKIKCKQCGKEISEEKAVEDKILRNHEWVWLKFCSTECAAHYQMGCEG
jgi:hypothetical protein